MSVNIALETFGKLGASEIFTHVCLETTEAYPDFLKQPLRHTPLSRHFASRVPFQRADCFVATVLTIQAGPCIELRWLAKWLLYRSA